VSKKKPKTIDASYPLSFMGCEGEVIVEMTPTEAVSMIEKAWQENKGLRQQIATLTEERDEARRMCCLFQSRLLGSEPLWWAKKQEWNCFTEEQP
jgi:hypothetical protein